MIRLTAQLKNGDASVGHAPTDLQRPQYREHFLHINLS